MQFIDFFFLHKGEFLVWIKTAEKLAPTHTYLFQQHMHGYFTCLFCQIIDIIFDVKRWNLVNLVFKQGSLPVPCVVFALPIFPIPPCHVFISSSNRCFGKASSSSPCFLGKFT